MEDDGGGKGSEYVLMADNVVTPVHNDNVEKVRKFYTFLLLLGIWSWSKKRNFIFITRHSKC